MRYSEIPTFSFRVSSLRWISFSRFCSATVSLVSSFVSFSVLRVSSICFTSANRSFCGCKQKENSVHFAETKVTLLVIAESRKNEASV